MQVLSGQVLRTGRNYKEMVILVVMVSTGVLVLHSYIGSALTSFMFGVAAYISVIHGSAPVWKNRFLLASLVLLILCWILPVNTLFYFSIFFMIVYLLELNGHSGSGILGLSAIFLSSPVFEYATAIVSFPLKMQLASWVGFLFSAWDETVTVSGNLIFRGRDEFAVDAACMGIQMISVSLLLGIILIGLQQRKSGRYLPWSKALLYLMMLFVLNLVSNLIRMMILIQFLILPENFLHDVTGLLCLAIYVCLPAAFLSRYMIRRWGISKTIHHAKKTPGKYQPVLFLVPLIFFLTAFRISTTDTYDRFQKKASVQVPGFTSALAKPGVIKLEKDNALVYVKFIRGFYDTEHHPMICWAGSGYRFQDIKESAFNGHTVYTSVLTNDRDTLYTAWWYYNGNRYTHRQWSWRMDMLKGSPGYALVNISAGSEEMLANQIRSLIQNHQLAALFSESVR